MAAHAKPTYRTTNWKDYNAALKARGSLLIWLDKDMRWHGSSSGKRGRTPMYSDAAVQFCLTIKGLFSQYYDLVLLDLGLPGKDGLDVLAGTRARNNPVPF